MVIEGKNVAGSGTTALGIIGTALGGLATLGGNGSLGNIFGGNRLADADAKIAKLEAERYTDQAVIRSQEKSAASDVVIATLTAKVNELAAQNAAEIKALKRESELQAEIDRQQAKINLMEAVAPLSAGMAANGVAISGIQQVLSGITKVVIPSSAVCGGNAARA